MDFKCLDIVGPQDECALHGKDSMLHLESIPVGNLTVDGEVVGNVQRGMHVCTKCCNDKDVLGTYIEWNRNAV